eukprot:CAMPEP_0197517460 /NCGR_PEP_ID=MMETSP1318-20131121/2476_1 /TAXON_ID=552666 /ORGANISM="Partenskyella glossopodia, Strain RCC365" /LENGTH=139 /DNA_ID=CAMNT_0043067037 /DNA_START=330 /DNA_END=746 /DNA_ORIENTATION=+
MNLVLEVYVCVCMHLFRNGDLDFYSRLDIDGCDLPNDIRRTVQIDHTLVDAHLEPIPGVSSLSTRRLPRGDSKVFGRKADRAVKFEAALLGSGDKDGANFFKRLNLSGRKGDPDARDFLAGLDAFLGLGCEGVETNSFK